MADKSGIGWTEATWNPVTGCTRVSAGCDNCYAFTLHDQRHAAQDRAAKEALTVRGVKGAASRIALARQAGYDLPLPKQYDLPFSTVQLHPDRLDMPLRWRKPRLIFVNSMSDLFHEDVPDEFIAAVFAVMETAPQHTFQVLTKRPDRMQALLTPTFYAGPVRKYGYDILGPKNYVPRNPGWPLPNVWLGTSVEDQPTLDLRVPQLLDTPASVRFVSAEPLLSALDFGVVGGAFDNQDVLRGWKPVDHGQFETGHPRLDWVIVGGESGAMKTPDGPERALVERCDCRFGPMAPHLRPPCELCLETTWKPKPEALDWVRSIRDQCQSAGVPLFFKQFGGPTPKSGGRTLDGRTWDEMPGRITE